MTNVCELKIKSISVGRPRTDTVGKIKLSMITPFQRPIIVESALVWLCCLQFGGWCRQNGSPEKLCKHMEGYPGTCKDKNRSPVRWLSPLKAAGIVLAITKNCDGTLFSIAGWGPKLNSKGSSYKGMRILECGSPESSSSHLLPGNQVCHSGRSVAKIRNPGRFMGGSGFPLSRE